MKLQNKVAFITGAGAGMGRQIAVDFVKEGAKVGFVEFKKENAEETAQILDSLGAEYTYSLVDVSDESALNAAMQQTAKKFGSIDILVNNVGLDVYKLVHEIDSATWDKCFAVNLKAAYITSKFVIPDMIKKQHGVIINVSSAAGYNPSMETPAYSSAKAGLIMLTKSMAMAYGKDHIRVNGIAPGVTQTTMLSQVTEEYIAALNQRIPLHRVGTVSDIAKAAVFLASDDSDYITGHTLPVDGGLILT